MFLVFVYSESRSTSKPWQMNSIDFYKGILLHVILVRIIVPCQKLPMISFVYKAKSVQKWSHKDQLKNNSVRSWHWDVFFATRVFLPKQDNFAALNFDWKNNSSCQIFCDMWYLINKNIYVFPALKIQLCLQESYELSNGKFHIRSSINWCQQFWALSLQSEFRSSILLFLIEELLFSSRRNSYFRIYIHYSRKYSCILKNSTSWRRW